MHDLIMELALALPALALLAALARRTQLGKHHRETEKERLHTAENGAHLARQAASKTERDIRVIWVTLSEALGHLQRCHSYGGSSQIRAAIVEAEAAIDQCMKCAESYVVALEVNDGAAAAQELGRCGAMNTARIRPIRVQARRNVVGISAESKAP